MRRVFVTCRVSVSGARSKRPIVERPLCLGRYYVSVPVCVVVVQCPKCRGCVFGWVESFRSQDDLDATLSMNGALEK